MDADDSSRQRPAVVLSRQREKSRGTERLEAFSDAVIAIVLTVLALQLFEVDADAVRRDGVAKTVLREWPAGLAFLMTFLVVGQIWVTHHNLWRYVERVDQGLLAINLALLLSVALIPLPARLLAEALRSPNPADLRVAAGLYAAVSLGQAIFFNLCLWWAHHRRLLDDAVDEGLYQATCRRYHVGPGIYLLALLAVLVSPWISIASYLGVVGLYVWPGAGDLPSEPTGSAE